MAIVNYRSTDLVVPWDRCGAIDGRPILFTDAPPEYDWGWSRVEAEEVAVLDGKRSVRVLSSESEYYRENQIARYESGLYHAATPEQFARWAKGGEVEWTPQFEVRWLRRTLVFPPMLDYEGCELMAAVIDLLRPQLEIAMEYRQDNSLEVRLLAKVKREAQGRTPLDAAEFVLTEAYRGIAGVAIVSE